MAKRIYLVDTENVNSTWKLLLPRLQKNDRMILFYTANSPYFSYGDLKTVLSYPESFEMMECYTGNNGLDFQLVSYMGYLMKTAAKTEYVIVSNDTGYDAAIKFWRDRERAVLRMTTPDILKPDRSSSQTAKAEAAPAAAAPNPTRSRRRKRSGAAKPEVPAAAALPSGEKAEGAEKAPEKPRAQGEKPAEKPSEKARPKGEKPSEKSRAKTEKAEPSEKPEKAEKSGKSEKPERAAKAEKSPEKAKAVKAEKSAQKSGAEPTAQSAGQQEKPEKPEKAEKQEKRGKAEKSPRGKSGSKGEPKPAVPAVPAAAEPPKALPKPPLLLEAHPDELFTPDPEAEDEDALPERASWKEQAEPVPQRLAVLQNALSDRPQEDSLWVYNMLRAYGPRKLSPIYEELVEHYGQDTGLEFYKNLKPVLRKFYAK